jgi:hypothetical protein
MHPWVRAALRLPALGRTGPSRRISPPADTSVPRHFPLALPFGRPVASLWARPFSMSRTIKIKSSSVALVVAVNKRTSRLASIIPLIKRNLVPLSFIDVPTRQSVIRFQSQTRFASNTATRSRRLWERWSADVCL